MKPSSAMIPGEILVSAFALVFALYGGVFDHWLNRELEARNENMVWLISLGVPAVLMIVLCLVEWFTKIISFGKRDFFVVWRGRIVLSQGVCFLYAVYVESSEAPMIATLCGICAAYCAVSYVENRRVKREIKCFAHPDDPKSKLYAL